MDNEVLVLEETEYLVVSEGVTELLEVSAPAVMELLEIAVQGPMGPPGPSGAAGGQVVVPIAAPSTNFQVLHNLNRYVFVEVRDDFGNEVLAEIQHTSLNEFYVRFGSPQTGKVIYI